MLVAIARFSIPRLRD